ncbi:lymphocyte antigen 6E isoform X1 [Cebus imitator]|nr:lymphocyte antigen 6E isoform X1 [Cebus imitator]
MEITGSRTGCSGLGPLGRTAVLSRMKTLLVLLAALLGVEQAGSLMCFSCLNQKSNLYCLKPTICSDQDNYCLTVTASAGIGKIVTFGHTLSKSCSPACPLPGNINAGIASMGIRCCQGFLCNFSAADGGLRASATLLGAGLLLSLLPALLRFGP